MNQSIDKEKSPKKAFSALDKIKKSKKNQPTVNDKAVEKTQFNVDSVLKNNVSEPIKTIPTPKPVEVSVSPVIDPIQESKPIVENKAVEVKSIPEIKEDVVLDSKINDNFDIASRLKINSELEFESTKNVSPSVLEESVEFKTDTRTSAEIAKDRLKEDVLGERRTPILFSEDIENKRTIKASDNLERILGNPHNDSQEVPNIYEDEEITNDDVVITKKSIFIPWNQASADEKTKARKIMSAGVATTLAALTYLTFH